MEGVLSDSYTQPWRNAQRFCCGESPITRVWAIQHQRKRLGNVKPLT